MKSINGDKVIDYLDAQYNCIYINITRHKHGLTENDVYTRILWLTIRGNVNTIRNNRTIFLQLRQGVILWCDRLVEIMSNKQLSERRDCPSNKSNNENDAECARRFKASEAITNPLYVTLFDRLSSNIKPVSG